MNKSCSLDLKENEAVVEFLTKSKITSPNGNGGLL